MTITNNKLKLIALVQQEYTYRTKSKICLVFFFVTFCFPFLSMSPCTSPRLWNWHRLYLPFL